MFAGGGVQMAATTNVVSVAVLGVVGSNSVAVAVAVFEIVPIAAFVGVTVIRTVAFAPLLSVPRLQVTVAVPEQLPCDGVEDTNVKFAGKMSTT